MRPFVLHKFVKRSPFESPSRDYLPQRCRSRNPVHPRLNRIVTRRVNNRMHRLLRETRSSDARFEYSGNLDEQPFARQIARISRGS